MLLYSMLCYNVTYFCVPEPMQIAHMDIGSRNARLYEQLKAMGLYVIPVFGDGDQIDHFHVSAGLPKYLSAEDLTHGGAQQSASGAVSTPVTSAQIVQLVRPTDS